MSAEPVPLRRLAPVDLDSGEVVDREVAALQARVESLESTVKDLEGDLRVKRAQLTKIKQDKVQERFDYVRADDVRRVHSYWQRKLGNKLSLTADRFDAVRGMLEERKYEILDGKARKVPAFEYPADFKRAIDGAAYDPAIKVMRNGRKRRFDDLELIFRSASHMQSFMDRSPH